MLLAPESPCLLALAVKGGCQIHVGNSHMVKCPYTPRVPSRYNPLISPQWYAGGTSRIGGAIVFRGTR